MQMIRVADYFTRFLAERGVDVAFMVSGGQMMHLIDSVGRTPSIHYYCNHHEQASAMAADGYARFSGGPGLCYATGGPGGTNVITGLVGAYQDSIPIIFLTGQCKVRDTIRGSGLGGLRQMGFLEVDILPIVNSVTKYAAFVERAVDARYHMEKAFHFATTGRPGPVLLDVPLDIQGAIIDPNALPGYAVSAEPQIDVSEAAEEILGALSDAERPVILAGHGVRCSGSVEAFRALAERLCVPILTTPIAKDLLPHAHSLFVGHPGIKGHRAANFAVQTADVVVVVGSSLSLNQTGWDPDQFAPSARKIHVDPDEAVLRKTRSIVTSQFRCQVGPIIAALSHAAYSRPIPASRHHAWRARCIDWKERYASAREPHRYGPAESPANLYEVIDVLSDIMSGNEVVLTDAGQPTYVVPQAFRLKGNQRYLAPASLAEMGWALPASLGVAAADPMRPVIAIVGDGSLQTNIQELQTLRHNSHFNVKIIVIANGGYASIRATQERFFDGFYVGATPDSGASLPNLSKIAAAYDLPYLLCPNRTMLGETFRQLLATHGPAVCEVVAQYDQELLPGVASVRQSDGQLRSAPLHLMSPPLPEEELQAILDRAI